MCARVHASRPRPAGMLARALSPFINMLRTWMTCLAVSPVTLRGSVGLGLAACIFSAPIAHADEPLEPVVVSATRVPSRINQLVADVTVMNKPSCRQPKV